MQSRPRFIPSLAAGLAVVGFLLGSALASAADSRPTIQQFLKIRTPRGPVLLPDGKLLTRDWPDGIFQLYLSVPKRSGTEVSYRPGDVTVTKLTDYPDGLSRFSVSPDGNRVILMHARGGNENTQLTLLELPAGPKSLTTPILANPKVQAAVNVWLRNSSGFIYSANDDSPTDFHLYRWDFAAGKATKILGEPGFWEAVDVTDDGSRVLVQKFVSASDAQCLELDTASGKLRDLSVRPANGTSACQALGYMPGERAVLMTSDIEGGKQRLFLRDLKSGKVREPVPSLAPFELDGALTNESREYLVAISNEDGYGVMRAFLLPEFKSIPLPPMEKGVATPVNFRGSTLLWANTNARNAGTAYATEFRKGAATEARQLTYTEDQGVDLKSFLLPELVKYPAFDGRPISAFLFLPSGYQKGSAIPFIIDYHGGPESQHRPYFNPGYQYYLSRGFGVMLPNVRGSTGYGRDFQMLDDYTKRWDSVRDGVDAAEWLVAQGYSAPGKIATSGGSYGGFMSVACVVEDQLRVDQSKRKERLFGACVDVVGVVNLKTFLEKTAGYRRKLREVEYGPLSDTTFLASVSSIHKADKINVPVFIGHGFNDPRVPVEEAMQLAVALKDRGQNPRVFIAPDEGHGFAKLDNRIYFYERAAAFLDETIGKSEKTSVAGARE